MQPNVIHKQRELNADLAAAVLQDDATAIKQAIQRGADINASGNAFSRVDNESYEAIPLCLAARKGRVVAANALIEAGANVDSDGLPLYLAAQNGHTTIVKALLEAGATVDLPCRDLGGPLCAAALYGNLEAAKLLLAAGADPLQKADDNNKTAVDRARSAHQTRFADYVQAVINDPAKRPTPEEAGLDIEKRVAALEALGKPLGQFTQLERMRKAQRETREAQRQAALRGEGI